MSWLSDKQLRAKIKKNADNRTKDAFYGIVPIDKLPSAVPHYPFFLIVNTHTHNLVGEHWLAVFIGADKKGEVFDSLALPLSCMLRQWMNRFTRSWIRNNKQYQHSLTSSCGAFTLYFILHRLRVKNFSGVLKCFTCKPATNEKIVNDFYKQLK